MRFLKAAGSLILSLLTILVLNTRIVDIPPLGKFLDPFQGFWNNAESRNIEAEVEADLDGLRDVVEISFDDQRILHIFAKKNHDLYYAQGYITAKDRLWEMDFQSRFASGRLSEVVGPKALELDRYQRRIGMAYG